MAEEENLGKPEETKIEEEPKTEVKAPEQPPSPSPEQREETKEITLPPEAKDWTMVQKCRYLLKAFGWEEGKPVKEEMARQIAKMVNAKGGDPSIVRYTARRMEKEKAKAERKKTAPAQPIPEAKPLELKIPPAPKLPPEEPKIPVQKEELKEYRTVQISRSEWKETYEFINTFLPDPIKYNDKQIEGLSWLNSLLMPNLKIETIEEMVLDSKTVSTLLIIINFLPIIANIVYALKKSKEEKPTLPPEEPPKEVKT